MSATIYRCLGGHVDEARDLIARDASETSIAAYEGLPGTPGVPSVLPAGEPVRLLTELADGRWKALTECPKCGAQDGRIGPRSLCQALIDRHQFHVASCSGRGAA